MSSTGLLLATASVFFAAPTADQVRDAKNTLRQRRLLEKGDCYALRDETGLQKSLREISDAQRRLTVVRRELSKKPIAPDSNASLIEQLLRRQADLSAQYNRVTTIREKNAIAAQLKELDANIQLAYQAREKEQMDRARHAEEINKAQHEFMQRVAAMRNAVDEVKKQYASLESDSEVGAAIRTLNEADGKSRRLGPSPFFASSEKKLAELEKTIHRDVVVLKRSGGDWLADVLINRKHAASMVVDTGASQVLVPSELAETVGLRPGPDTPKVSVQVASGQKVDAYLMTLSSLRVGRFELHDVPCLVLPKGFPGAHSLLGNSFLSNFTVTLDGANGRLTLSEVKADSAKRGKR